MPLNAAAKPPRVLIVDDGNALRALLCSLLSNEGFKVVGDLDRGHAVLATVEKTRPDLVCLDYNLPDTDGITLLRQIHQAYPDIAVVMITGSHDPRLHAESAEAGAAGFLRKPFSQQQIVQELRHVLHARQLMAGISPLQALGTPLSGKGVVIADDSAALRRLLSAILSSSGMEVLAEAENGQQAVDLTRRLRPDLLCLDIDMPVMNGLEALGQIHMMNPKLPVMMITAHADKDTVKKAGELGARGYILKPYQPEKVVQALETLFSKKAG